MSPVKSLKTIQPKVWIPPQYTANYKITVERTDGTIDDITDIILKLKITDGTTSSIGSFEFEIPNPNETYTSTWTGMEIFRFYSDYATGDATTLRFRGRVEKSSKRNNNVLVTGRGEGLFVQDQVIYKNYVAEDIGVIIKDLFDTYGQDRFDTSEINESTGITASFTFYGTPFFDAIEAVCLAAGYDCYVSCNLVVKFFESGSVTNNSEAIVHDYNLIEVGDFAEDLQFMRNQVRVVGGSIDGVQVMYTANDTAENQTRYGIRREQVNDDGIIDFNAAQELAEFLLAEKKDPQIVGEVKGLLLATIQPGEKIMLSSPIEGLAPTGYQIISYEHDISEEGLYTTVKINKEQRKVSHVIKERIQREYKKNESSSNPDDLDFSFVELFNADVGATTSTEITQGVLQLQSGETTGTWVSLTHNIPGDATLNNVKVDLVGDNLPGVDIEVSYDQGITYTPVSRGVIKNFAVGTTIKIRLTLETGSQVDSLLVQYSTL